MKSITIQPSIHRRVAAVALTFFLASSLASLTAAAAPLATDDS